MIEPEPVQDAGRPGRRAVRLLVLQAFVNLDDPRVIRRDGGLALQGGELVVGCEHGLDRFLRPRGRLLARHADPPAPGHADRSLLRLQGAGDQAEKRRLAGPVAADESHAVAGVDHRACPVEQHPVTDPVLQVVDPQHGRGVHLVPRITTLGPDAPLRLGEATVGADCWRERRGRQPTNAIRAPTSLVQWSARDTTGNNRLDAAANSLSRVTQSPPTLRYSG